MAAQREQKEEFGMPKKRKEQPKRGKKKSLGCQKGEKSSPKGVKRRVWDAKK